MFNVGGINFITILTLLLFGLKSVKPVFSYVLPEPTFQILQPRGLRVSIPDAPGIQVFAFHANVNKAIGSEDVGEISGEAFRARNGKWIVENSRKIFNNGDVVNYWIYAQVNGNTYKKEPQRWTVSPTNTGGKNEVTGETKERISTSPAKQIFNEEFNSLDTSVWIRDIKMPLEPDFEFCVYHNAHENVLFQVTNGTLRIRPLILEDSYGEGAVTFGRIQLDGCTSYIPMECSRQAAAFNILPPVISSRLTTKKSFSFQYGKIEIRAKFPEGDWLYPEIWLEPKYSSYGAGYASGRVLLGLSRGNVNLVNASDVSKVYDSRRLDFGLRVGENLKIHEEMVSKIQEGSRPWTKDFHVYTTTWSQDGFIFSVDGQEVGRLDSGPNGWMQGNSANSGRKGAPFDQEFYITIGVGVGGIRVFPDNTISAGVSKPWRNSGAKAMLQFWNSKAQWLPSWRRQDGTATALEVDYVRVWSL